MESSEHKDNKTNHLQQCLKYSEDVNNVLWSFILHLPFFCLHGKQNLRSFNVIIINKHTLLTRLD